MRFYNFLDEQDNFDEHFEELIELLNKECKPFLNDFKKQDKKNIDWLFRGLKNINQPFFDIKLVRKNRRPLDTPEKIHKLLDDWFYKKFHIKARSESVFCSFDMNTASNFGKRYIIFPIGKYDIIWSEKINDLYENLINYTEIKDFYSDDEYYSVRYDAENSYDRGKWVYKDYVYNGSSRHYAVMFFRDQIRKNGDEKTSVDDIKWDMKFIPELSIEEYEKKLIDDFLKKLENGKYRKTSFKEIPKFYLGELMIYCDKYIYVNPAYLPKLKEYIFKIKRIYI